ncbi:MAG: HNH endonuclease [Planctomycetaceae bacterium]|nr:HNH endonuclease [Planctomycetaceae bacterium]
MPRSPQRRANGRHRPVDRRPTATQRGYDARWRKYRAAFLATPANALCRECRKRGRITPATVVDHIVPHLGDAVVFWDPGNHQPLCHSCHSRKTVREDGGFGNRRKESHVPHSDAS